MGGGHLLQGVSIFVDVVDHQTLFASVLVSADLALHFRGLAGEHGTEDEFDMAQGFHEIQLYRESTFKSLN